MTITTTDEMIAAFTSVFGDHGEVVSVDEGSRRVSAVVRECFEVGFALEPEHGLFSIAVRTGARSATTTFFGQPPLLDPEEVQVHEMLERVHRWTTLRTAIEAR